MPFNVTSEVDLDKPTCKMGRYLAQSSSFSLADSIQGLIYDNCTLPDASLQP